MLTKFQTRIGSVNDAEMISGFVSELAKRHIAVTLERDGIESLLTSISTKATRVRLCSNYHHILAEVEDRLVGLATIRNPSHLYQLFVETNHQRKGLGRQLFEYAQDHVYRTTGSKSMTVNSSLNSTGMYRSLGFTIVGDVQTTDGVRYQPMRWGNAT